MIEFWMALGTNFIGTACIFAWFSMLVGIAASIGYIFSAGRADDRSNSDYRREDWGAWVRIWKKTRNACLAIFVPSCLISNIPTADNVWKMRIALIKFNLASPENVMKAADTIERIGHKLECKYIGCEEPKEKK